MVTRFLFLFFFLTLSAGYVAQAQRRLPYPILFVHGFAGKSDNWLSFVNYLSVQAGIYAASNNRLDYCLNSDGDQSIALVYAASNWRSDVFDYNLTLSPSDLYVINFDTCPSLGGSNRSAAVKQGYAVGLAVARILAVTGSDKVILMGHSMGGLAIREYLQTSTHWATSDGRHHVAKVVTVGTPHGGSNFGSGDLNFLLYLASLGTSDKYDEQSEAVRDLRIDYKTGYSGVYLWGGYETSTYIRQGSFGSYYNLDVNCNGRAGDLIQGLNQKSMPNDLDYALVVGNGYGTLGDGVVTTTNQNLNNFYPLNAPIFYHSFFHTNAIANATFPEVWSLDEPSQSDKAYAIGFDRSYTGFLTVQANGSWRDYDRYRFFAPSRGVVTANLTISADAASTMRLLNTGGQTLISQNGAGYMYALLPNGGDNYLDIEGTSGSGWRTYLYDLQFCPMPQDPVITASRTDICVGEAATLTATPGYDSYIWTRDGQRIDGNSSQLAVNVSGTYVAQGLKCGLNRYSNLSSPVTVNPKPDVPFIGPSPDGQGLLSSAAVGNQWYLNGSPIVGATAPVLPYARVGAGAVSLQVTTPKGCSNTSSPFLITATEPVAEPGLSVSPNPSSGVVVIRTSYVPPFALRLTNLTGQTLWQKAVTSREREHTLDVSAWPAGLYLLRLESDTGGQTVKMLVE